MPSYRAKLSEASTQSQTRRRPRHPYRTPELLPPLGIRIAFQSSSSSTPSITITPPEDELLLRAPAYPPIPDCPVSSRYPPLGREDITGFPSPTGSSGFSIVDEEITDDAVDDLARRIKGLFDTKNILAMSTEEIRWGLKVGNVELLDETLRKHFREIGPGSESWGLTKEQLRKRHGA